MITLSYPCHGCGSTLAHVPLKSIDGSMVTCRECGKKLGELSGIMKKLIAQSREADRRKSEKILGARTPKKS